MDVSKINELGWNHTTLRALKFDPSITYLQVRYAFPEHRELIEALQAHDEARALDVLDRHLQPMPRLMAALDQ